ncbi:hypothetical protein FBQ85_20470 [Cytophagia bacterium CHB2]|nr:hypothetical protein [Cytophagia bacterium CHB2]
MQFLKNFAKEALLAPGLRRCNLHRARSTFMTLQEIIAGIHALKDDLEKYERKYSVLSETFHTY